MPQCLGIEAGMPTHYVVRELIALGHDVKQVPPAYTRPFRQGHKNDFSDAQAIAEAQRPLPKQRADDQRQALCWSFEVRRATVDCSFRGKWRRVLRRRRGSPCEAPSGIPMVLRELRDGNAKPFAFMQYSVRRMRIPTSNVDYVEALAHSPHWSRFRSQRCTT